MFEPPPKILTSEEKATSTNFHCWHAILPRKRGFCAELQALPPSSQAFNLTTMVSHVNWCNAPWCGSDFSIPMNRICFISQQVISPVINECMPLLLSKILFGIHKSFTQLLCFQLVEQNGGHSSGFSHEILTETF